MRRLIGLVLGAALWPAVGLAQEEAPVVRVAGTGEVMVSPDYATLDIGVRIQQQTAEAAAAAMSRHIEAIVDTLVDMGFAQDSLPTQVFSISADPDRQEGNRITGYTAVVTLQVNTRELDRLADFVGAAVTAGATEVRNVRFHSTGAEEARAEALRQAVAMATREAEVIAEARGARLGRLLEIGTVQDGGIRLRGMSALAERTFESFVARSALIPQQIAIEAWVTGTWELELN